MAEPTSQASVPSWLSNNNNSAAFGGGACGCRIWCSSTKGKRWKEQGRIATIMENRAQLTDSDNGDASATANDAAFGAHAPEQDDSPANATDSTPSGEENEVARVQQRVKLFRMVKSETSGSWVEVGFGPLRVNVPNDEHVALGKSPRSDAPTGVWTLLLNAPITSEMTITSVGDKMMRLTCESFTAGESEQVTTAISAFHQVLTRCRSR